MDSGDFLLTFNCIYLWYIRERSNILYCFVVFYCIVLFLVVYVRLCNINVFILRFAAKFPFVVVVVYIVVLFLRDFAIV